MLAELSDIADTDSVTRLGNRHSPGHRGSALFKNGEPVSGLLALAAT
jgi:hypothetical protein